MAYIKDNYDFFEKHEAEIARQTMHRPTCSCCKRPIMDDYAYEIDDGLVCAECLDDEYKVYIDEEDEEWD
jgi:formylmethanofuran dehydrogenase subunit E